MAHFSHSKSIYVRISCPKPEVLLLTLYFHTVLIENCKHVVTLTMENRFYLSFLRGPRQDLTEMKVLVEVVVNTEVVLESQQRPLSSCSGTYLGPAVTFPDKKDCPGSDLGL